MHYIALVLPSIICFPQCSSMNTRSFSNIECMIFVVVLGSFQGFEVAVQAVSYRSVRQLNTEGAPVLSTDHQIHSPSITVHKIYS
ncbi:hypothetical protein BC830DRAFT_1113189 [Chytriomyces sp. MP71]|nr:hypothetical protein BC830DRAFT_1113189 [Chytriomyces sp. MP71]